MRIVRFILDFWYVPFFVVGSIFFMLVLSRKSRPWSATERIGTELAAIRAQREARDLKIQLGAEQAKQHVLDKYAEKRKSLDAATAARVQELEDNPEKLAKTLERLTR